MLESGTNARFVAPMLFSGCRFEENTGVGAAIEFGVGRFDNETVFCNNGLASIYAVISQIFPWDRWYLADPFAFERVIWTVDGCKFTLKNEWKGMGQIDDPQNPETVDCGGSETARGRYTVNAKGPWVRGTPGGNHELPDSPSSDRRDRGHSEDAPT